MKNGYFKLVSDDSGYGVKIFAPVDGGQSVNIGELTDYLSIRGIGFDLYSIKRAIDQGKDVVTHLGDGVCPLVNTTYILSIEEDGMKAVARFYPPSETGVKITVQEFLSDLGYRKIQYGVCENQIWDAYEKEKYCTDIIVAKGIPARQGTDAVIEYCFSTDLKAKPTENEDGSVDFFHLNSISHCQAGDILARLTPADPGECGTSIQGLKIKPRDVKKATLRYGNNIDISEDKQVLTSKVDGHVTLVDDRVFVSNNLELQNVDISTGNIEFEGNVTVNGNVQSNFSVKARGNIMVNGLVEGAYLEAGGDIIISRGMAGMSKGELRAGGNIVAKFLENTKVTAAGYINTEAILHSTVMAGLDITVNGKRGYITGGRVCATNQIQVKTLGSHMGTSTILEVGADPVIKNKYQKAQKDVTELTKVVKGLDPIIANYLIKRKQGIQLSHEQLAYLSNIIRLREQKVPELKNANSELEALQQVIEQQSYAQIVVTGEVFPGVKIVIGDVSMAIQDNMKYCKFIKLHGDVKMVAI
ncbi:MAG TPA: FapA family protein [Lachnospiraceae bacterium]|nr:FapA family protein [Lachnospiraceae bacterium]